MRAQHAVLGANSHGKARVRVAKVRRGVDGQHIFVELNVRLELRGGAAESYTVGDNRMVVATDTCKNHVYILAKKHSCETPEEFARDLALGMLSEYGHLESVSIQVEEVPWARVKGEDGFEHSHGFVKTANGRRSAVANACRVPSQQRPDIQIVSSLSDLAVLKTTQSGFSNFHRGRYQTLPDTDERIVATSITAEWGYATSAYSASAIDYGRVHESVRKAIVRVFYGPSKVGEFSRGVQETLFKIGSAVLADVPDVSRITMKLPNLHFLPCNLPVFAKNGISFEDDVYIPTDEPHGIICATVQRPGIAKL